MSYHTLTWTFEELGKALGKSLEVEFECSATPGDPGSYWEPPTPPEIEFSDVTIIELLSEADQIVVGDSWQEFLKAIAFNLAEKFREHLEESLVERISDYEDAALEDYYDLKRDELRGC